MSHQKTPLKSQSLDTPDKKEAEHQFQERQRLQQFALRHEVNLAWPAVIQSVASSPQSSTIKHWPPPYRKPLRTSDEIIQLRLLEAGILYDVPVSLLDTVQACNAFVADLNQTGCFNTVHVEIDRNSTENLSGNSREESTETKEHLPQSRLLKVELEEANWYRLYLGGGLKSDVMFKPERLGDNTGFLSMAEAEVSAGLRNIEGCLDTTNLHFTLDTKALATWALVHTRPLYTVLPNVLKQFVLLQPHGSQYTLHAKGVIDTIDFEWTRSYKEFQRIISIKATNTPMATGQQQASSPYFSTSLEWMTLLRDICPRRHINLPYAFHASPAVVSQAGPSVKHSFVATIRTNGEFLDNNNGQFQHPLQPLSGMQGHAEAELATPPGDVGFFKCQGGASLHFPTTKGINPAVLHLSINAGYLHSLSFGGLCRPATISDRFFVGGPLQLRGFSPAGIGPRSYPQPSVYKNSHGDSLGGDFFYTATSMLSFSPVESSVLQNMLGYPVASALRLFGFVNAGTCVGTIHTTPLWAVLQSTRVSLGVGLSTASLGPRLEVTYATPLRSGPLDTKRQFQFGVGFTFG